MIEEELYNEYRKSDYKSFTDFLINKIAELKKTYRKQRNKRIDELQKENAELKKKYVKNITDCDICDTYCNLQLTKAKEIIKDLMCFIGGAVALHDCKRSKDIDVEKLKADTEQFLSEVEK